MGGRHVSVGNAVRCSTGSNTYLNFGKEWANKRVRFIPPNSESDFLFSLNGDGKAPTPKTEVERMIELLEKDGRLVPDGERDFYISHEKLKSGEIRVEALAKDEISRPATQIASTGQQQTGAAPPSARKSRNTFLAEINLNLLLEGVPGTGKTYAFDCICDELRVAKEHRFVLNCHPSTQYEDVIEGLRPSSVKQAEHRWQSLAGGSDEDHAEAKNGWHVVDGQFLRACSLARANPNQKVAILLDELNRANVPRILGDLMTALERSKRWDPTKDGTFPMTPLRLPLSGRSFLVPKNLIVVATMNTVDHSVAPLDQALLRRFWRARLEPMSATELKRELSAAPSEVTAAIDHFDQLNAQLSTKLGADAMIGHSFLFEMAALCAERSDRSKDAALVKAVWRYGVAPQVIAAIEAAGKEHWFVDKAPSAAKPLIDALKDCQIELIRAGEGSTARLRLKPAEEK